MFLSRNSIIKKAVGSVIYTPTEVFTILIFDEDAFNAEVNIIFFLSIQLDEKIIFIRELFRKKLTFYLLYCR